MEDDQIIPASDTTNSQIDSPDNSSKGKNIAIVIVIILVIFAIGGLAFWFGSSSSDNQSMSITPTPKDNLSVFDQIPTEAQPSPTKSVALSGTPTPTKKPTPTATPSPTPTANIKTKTLASSSALDGFESSNGGGNKDADIRAGRNSNLVTRGFVSFDLSSLPAEVEIASATLRLYQAKVIGDPYGVGGALKVDHLTYGTTLENSDYGLAALTSNATTLTLNAVIEWKDATVTESVKKDLDESRTRSQFRLHFTTETIGGNVTGDFAYLESADNSEATGKTPELVIKYY